VVPLPPPSSPRPRRRPLDVVSTATERSLVGGGTTLTVKLRLDADVDALHVQRRLLELVEGLGDFHADRRERGELL
jgi:hypothetical protein